MIKPSSDQIIALQDIKKLFSSNHREQVLTGSPGTGKSFLTTQVIAEARDAKYQLILAATTHPAVKVLADFTGEHVITLHKLLDLKVLVDYKTDTTSTVRRVSKKGPMIEQLANTYAPILLVIDEASYIDNEIHHYIEQLLLNYPTLFILYVGDKDQLPPVGSETPHVFAIGKPTSILTTDHRYASTSQMANIVYHLKKNIHDKSYFLVNIDTGNDVTIINEQTFKDKMYELYTSDEYAQNPRYVKSMAYRNNVVNNINTHVRSYFYDQPDYQKGERLIVNSPLVRKNEILANNGDIVTVIDNRQTSLRDVAGQLLTLERENNKPFEAIVTTAYRKKNIERKKLVKQQSWKALYAFMESFIEVKDMYACTIHKAQGATYNNVLLHLEDLVECQEHTLLARLLLVAVSRASEHVYIYGSIPQHLLRQ